MQQIKLLCFLCVFEFGLAQTDNFEPVMDYYWRDYTPGKIPSDALSGGYDLNGKPTYIGQAYFDDHYLQVVRIYPHVDYVTACHGGNHNLKTTENIKILCSRNLDRFRWLPVSGNTFHVTTIGKHVVRGGTQDGMIINVGRVSYKGELIVGKVCAYNWNQLIGEATLYFPYIKAEQKTTNFEVLVYEPLVI